LYLAEGRGERGDEKKGSIGPSEKDRAFATIGLKIRVKEKRKEGGGKEKSRQKKAFSGPPLKRKGA